MKLRTAAVACLFVVAGAGAQPVRVAVVQSERSGSVAPLWEAPADIRSRNLLHGAGGAELAPKAGSTFTWISTDQSGYSAGFDVHDANGLEWSVKLGLEAQSEVACSRLLWAIGYHQPPTYYVPEWNLSGGPGGSQPGARFRPKLPDAKVVGEWAWEDNPFTGTQPFRGLIVANILLNSWDWKTSNNKIYRYADGTQRYVVRDLGASLGETSPSRLLGVIPMRGFGQGSRNDIDGFESRGFIKRVDGETIEFDFDTIYSGVVEMVGPADVKWTIDLFSQLSDAQWHDAFLAAGHSPEVGARYVAKIKSKMREASHKLSWRPASAGLTPAVVASGFSRTTDHSR